MTQLERDQDREAVLADSTEEGPALRDAVSTAARMEADEAAAVEARERLRTAPLPTIDADRRIAPQL